jgi:hypothetical protein
MRATVTALALIAVCAAACSSAAQPSASPMASTNPPTTPPAFAPTATPPPTLPGEIPTPPTSRFEEALSYLLPDEKMFYFNDWAAIKESLGAEDVTGASSEEDKRRVFAEGLSPPPNASPRPGSAFEAIVDGYGAQNVLGHASVWGFDVFDYEWEASFNEGPKTHIIRFREGFDLAPIIAMLDEREFSSERLENATLRMHETAPVDWALDLAIFNVALLDDGRTMLLSYDPDSLRAHLATFKPDQTAAVSSVGEAVGEPWAATIVLDGANFCQSISPSADSSAADLLETAGPLGAWDAMAFAYSREVSTIGKIAFGYEDEGQAQSDLEGRRLLAEEGTSLYEDGPPYAYYFAVDDAEAADGVLQLLVSPANDWPGHLFTPVYVRDLLFAACPD